MKAKLYVQRIKAQWFEGDFDFEPLEDSRMIEEFDSKEYAIRHFELNKDLFNVPRNELEIGKTYLLYELQFVDDAGEEYQYTDIIIEKDTSN